MEYYTPLGYIYICVITYICDTMANITLSVPDSLHKEMKQFSDIRWSQVARNAIIEKIEVLKMADKLAQKSKLTEKDIKEFSKKIKSNAAKRFNK